MKAIALLLLLVLYHVSSLQAQPNKIWATYYGDGPNDFLGTDASSVVYDANGYLYVAGFVFDSSMNVATPGSFKAHMTGPSDAYLAKFDTLGNRIWATYIGNEKIEGQPRITLDNAGNIIVSCMSDGDQNLIATPGSYQPNLPASTDYSYLVKFNGMGQRLWGTYLTSGNTPNDTTKYFSTALVTDGQRNIYVCGYAAGNNPFPASNAFMSIAPADGSNGFLMKFDETGTFLWGTYYGGEGLDDGSYLACSPAEVYMVGATNSSTGIATLGAAYPMFNGNAVLGNGNSGESYVAKFNADGSLVGVLIQMELLL